MSNIKDDYGRQKGGAKYSASIAGLLLFLLLGVSIVMDGFDAVYHTISIILRCVRRQLCFLALK